MAVGLQALLSQQRAMSESGCGGGSSEDEADATCPACHLPRKAKKRYCEVHHSAFETLQRHACRPPAGQEEKVRRKLMKRKTKAKSKAKKNTDASDTSSSELPMTDEHRAFVAIFGEGKRNKGDPITANRVLCEFATKFPKGGKKH